MNEFLSQGQNERQQTFLDIIDNIRDKENVLDNSEEWIPKFLDDFLDAINSKDASIANHVFDSYKKELEEHIDLEYPEIVYQENYIEAFLWAISPNNDNFNLWRISLQVFDIIYVLNKFSDISVFINNGLFPIFHELGMKLPVKYRTDLFEIIFDIVKRNKSLLENMFDVCDYDFILGLVNQGHKIKYETLLQISIIRKSISKFYVLTDQEECQTFFDVIVDMIGKASDEKFEIVYPDVISNTIDAIRITLLKHYNMDCFIKAYFYAKLDFYVQERIKDTNYDVSAACLRLCYTFKNISPEKYEITDPMYVVKHFIDCIYLERNDDDLISCALDIARIYFGKEVLGLLMSMNTLVSRFIYFLKKGDIQLKLYTIKLCTMIISKSKFLSIQMFSDSEFIQLVIELFDTNDVSLMITCLKFVLHLYPSLDSFSKIPDLINIFEENDFQQKLFEMSQIENSSLNELAAAVFEQYYGKQTEIT